MDLFNWAWLEQWVDSSKNGTVPELIAKTPVADILSAVRKQTAILDEILRLTANRTAADPMMLDEMVLGIRGSILMHKTAAVMVQPGVLSEYEIADELRRFESQLTEVWHKRNKPSEYYRVREAMMKIAEKLDAQEKARS